MATQFEDLPTVILQPVLALYHVRFPKKTEKKIGSLVLAETNPARPQIAQVLATGPGFANPIGGGYFPLVARPGDIILVSQHGPVLVPHLDEFVDEPPTWAVSETDLLAIYRTREQALEMGITEKFWDDEEPIRTRLYPMGDITDIHKDILKQFNIEVPNDQGVS